MCWSREGYNFEQFRSFLHGISSHRIDGNLCAFTAAQAAAALTQPQLYRAATVDAESKRITHAF